MRRFKVDPHYSAKARVMTVVLGIAAGPHATLAFFASWIARQTRSGVSGMSI
jgi:hypothetical protein